MTSTFFSFRHIEKLGKPLTLSCECMVKGDTDKFALSYAEDAKANFSHNGKKMDIVLAEYIPSEIKVRLGDSYKEHSESYAILVAPEENAVYLYAPSHRGLIYAVSTLIQLTESGDLTDRLFLFDYPDMDVRGYRVYTPSARQFDTFKAMVDKLVYYKYNSIIIEVGGLYPF